ncbi:Mediator of RNA polymerase II transcription subunit 14 [Aphelenchoides besseyi]|nr:Mediator of RNA polymerase II transcription subunit 14 [Aphelenchoides besseyi]
MNVLTDRQNMLFDNMTNGTMSNTNQRVVEQETRVVLPPVPEQNEPPSVSLTYLIDLAVQETYRLWTITVEYMERRNDMDRKICMVDFTRTTRTLYLKLYAVVKWARIAKALDQKTTGINYVLDQFSQHYVEMADSLARLAREELVFARLPLFQVPTAIDKKHIPEEPLTQEEQIMTVKHLEQMLEYRLLQESQFLPVGLTDIKIGNGMAIFTAPNEFQVHMTLMRVPENQETANFEDDFELKNWQWTLLDLNILVVDYEMGLGRPLIHTIHKQLLIDICCTSMRHSYHDVHIVYDILHDFCLKLQLDLLFCQAQSLCQSISTDYVSIEAYDPRDGFLSILYWMPHRKTTEFRMVITRNQNSACGKLKLLHQPYAFNLPQLEFINGQPQFHSLFTKTVMYRCRDRLTEVKRMFVQFESSSPSIRLIDDKSIRLIYRLVPLDDAEPDESLYLAVNTYSGRILCSIPALDDRQSGCSVNNEENWMGICTEGRCSELEELEEEMNSNGSIKNKKIGVLLKRLHLRLIARRIAQTATDFHFRTIIPSRLSPWIDKLEEPGDERIYLQFNWEPYYYLIISMKMENKANSPFRLFTGDLDGQKVKLHELNIATLIRDTPISDFESTEFDIRKWLLSDANLLTATRRQIRVALSTIADRLLFVRLTEKLQHRGVKFLPFESEKEVGGYVLRITDFANKLRRELSIPSETDLFRSLVSCSLRLQGCKNQLKWSFECVLKNVLLVSDVGKTAEEVEYLKHQFFSHVQDMKYTFYPGFLTAGTIGIVDAVQQNFVDSIKIYANMFNLTQRFAIAYNHYFKDLCSIIAFSYHKLTILYGHRRDLILIISYKVNYNGFWVNFAQSTGPNNKRAYNNRWNAHSIVAIQLSQRLNLRHNSNRQLTEEDQTNATKRQQQKYLDESTDSANDDEDPILSVVNYVLNTDRTLNLIHHFAHSHLRSLKPYSQMIGFDEQNFPFEHRYNLSVITPEHLRLVCGVVHMDIRLLHDNRIALEGVFFDEQRRALAVPFFLEFWDAHSRNVSSQLLVLNDGTPEDTTSPNDSVEIQEPPLESQEVIRLRQMSGGAGPAHARIHAQKSRTAASSPVAAGFLSRTADQNESQQSNTSTSQYLDASPFSPPPRPTSAPAAAARNDNSPNNIQGVDTLNPNSNSNDTTISVSTHIPIYLIDADTLESAMAPRILSIRNPYQIVDDNPNHMKPTSPMDEYLHSFNFISKIGAALGRMSKNMGTTGHFPLSSIQSGPGYVNMKAVGLPPPDATIEPWNVQINVFICPQTFTARCRLEFTGSTIPDAEHVRSFENYFRMRLVPHGNEMAVLSFVTACRVMVDGVFAAFAKLMETEILGCANDEDEDTVELFWKVCMQLSVMNRISPNENPNKFALSRRFLAGVMINKTGKHLLITLSLRTPRVSRNQSIMSRKVELVYVIPNNIIIIRNVYNGEQALDADKKEIEILMGKLNSEEIQDCRLWPAIRCILDRYRSRT